jgi:hypothetical protein
MHTVSKNISRPKETLGDHHLVVNIIQIVYNIAMVFNHRVTTNPYGRPRGPHNKITAEIYFSLHDRYRPS